MPLKTESKIRKARLEYVSVLGSLLGPYYILEPLVTPDLHQELHPATFQTFIIIADRLLAQFDQTHPYYYDLLNVCTLLREVVEEIPYLPNNLETKIFIIQRLFQILTENYRVVVAEEDISA